MSELAQPAEGDDMTGGLKLGPVSVDTEVIEASAQAASKLNPVVLSSILYAGTMVGCMMYAQWIIGPEHIRLMGDKIDPLAKAIATQTERNDRHLLEQNAILREALKLKPLGAQVTHGPGE